MPKNTTPTPSPTYADRPVKSWRVLKERGTYSWRRIDARTIPASADVARITPGYRDTDRADAIAQRSVEAVHAMLRAHGVEPPLAETPLLDFAEGALKGVARLLA